MAAQRTLFTSESVTEGRPDKLAEQIRADIERLVIRHAIPAELFDDKTIIFVNPTGRFVVGGPHGDAGLTVSNYRAA